VARGKRLGAKRTGREKTWGAKHTGQVVKRPVTLITNQQKSYAK